MSLGDIIDWVEENPQDAAIRIFALERENIILERENAALRTELEAAKAFHRVAVAERDAARKEAKP